MSKIRIKNFGPIKDGFKANDGWIDIKKVTLFIGNQGSGKSTIAKLISTFTWIEKALTRGDFDNKWFSRKSKLKNQFLNYHRIENYLNPNELKSEIEYLGDAYHIKFESEILVITSLNESTYPLPQIMYVPAERNFIAYVKSAKELKLSSESLKEFLTEYDNAKDDLKDIVKLPINNVVLEYDKLNDIVNVKGDGYKVRLTDASSGFQSLVPLYLVSSYLTNSVRQQNANSNDSMSVDELDRFKKGIQEIWSNNDFTEEQRRVALSVLSSRFNKTAFINIVEEPEQNLFPSSQRQMLNSLLEFNNVNIANKLIMTSHSPYIINYLSLAVKAYFVAEKIQLNKNGESMLQKLEEIVPLKSLLNTKDLVIYELDDLGNVIMLDDYKGLPSDENYLNEKLSETNYLFSDLLEIEDLCQ